MSMGNTPYDVVTQDTRERERDENPKAEGKKRNRGELCFWGTTEATGTFFSAQYETLNFRRRPIGIVRHTHTHTNTHRTYRPPPFRSASVRANDVPHWPHVAYVEGSSRDFPYSACLFVDAEAAPADEKDGGDNGSEVETDVSPPSSSASASGGDDDRKRTDLGAGDADVDDDDDVTLVVRRCIIVVPVQVAVGLGTTKASTTATGGRKDVLVAARASITATMRDPMIRDAEDDGDAGTRDRRDDILVDDLAFMVWLDA